MEGTDRQTEKVGHEARERNRQSDKEIFCFGHAIHTCAITNSMGFCSSLGDLMTTQSLSLKPLSSRNFHHVRPRTPTHLQTLTAEVTGPNNRHW